MNTVAMAGLCAGVGLGILLILQGIRGKRILPSASAILPDGTSTAVATAWFAGAVIAGLVVLVATRWVGAGLGVLALVIALPRFLGGARLNSREIERTQAIASWTEMVRDNLAGAAGLEQALMATADIAPAPIAAEVKHFSNQLENRPLVDALVVLGDSLTHASADLVVVSLANASRMEGRDLGPLLTRLAESIRADVRMRQRIDIGRARIRTSSKIVLAVTLITVAMIYFTSENLLAVYDTANGQLWLLAVFALFICSLWMMNYFADIEVPERFTARRVTSGPFRNDDGQELGP